MLAIEAPFPQFFDTDGSPMDAGQLFFGVANQNPETSPITVYWDAAATQPAAQPIPTLNGYAVRNGTPAAVFVGGDYSLNARNKRGSLIFYAPTSNSGAIDGTLARTVDAITAVNATGLQDGAVIIAKGRSAAGDGGGGIFRYVSGSAQAEDGGTVFAPATGSGRLFRDGWTVFGFNGQVNVKWFGAKGDNSTDDAASINNGVAALVTFGGGTLFFPEGTFLVSTHVKIRDRIHYLGAGWSSTIKAHPTSVDNVIGHFGPDYDFDIFDVKISDLAIDGNRANVAYNTANAGATDDAFQNGIRLHKVKRYRIENCYIHDTVFNGISVYFLSSDGVITNNTVKDIGKVGNPASGASSYEGIFVEYAADNILIAGNTINTTRELGILIQTATDGGIRNISIIDNIILSTFSCGIYVKDQGAGGTGPLENIDISGNTIKGCSTGATEAAIRVERVSFGMRAKNVTISHNRVIANNFIGILANTNTERCTVAGNIVADNVDKGIVNAGTDVAVIGNVCLGNGVDAIDFSAATRPSTVGNIDRFTGADGNQGSFTPTLLTGGAAVGRTYSAQEGSYRVNGNRVFFTIRIILSAKGSSAGSITIAGLPITSKSSGPFGVPSVAAGNLTYTGSPTGLILNSQTSINIYAQATATLLTALTDTALANTSEFYITGSYEI